MLTPRQQRVLKTASSRCGLLPKHAELKVKKNILSSIKTNLMEHCLVQKGNDLKTTDVIKLML